MNPYLMVIVAFTVVAPTCLLIAVIWRVVKGVSK